MPDDIAEAHRFMTRLLVAGRLLAPNLERPGDAAATILAQSTGCTDYAAMLSAFTEARRAVAALWRDLFDMDLEID